MLNLDKLSRVHESLLGESPAEEHLVLYRAFPKFHGFFATEPLNLRQFEAVSVLGLASTYPFDGSMHKTWFLVPATLEDWAVEGLQKIGQRIFARIKQEANLKAANFMRRAFEHLDLGSRAFAFEEPPQCWVSFGFAKTAPIPDWLQNGLLPV